MKGAGRMGLNLVPCLLGWAFRQVMRVNSIQGPHPVDCKGSSYSERSRGAACMASRKRGLF